MRDGRGLDGYTLRHNPMNQLFHRLKQWTQQFSGLFALYVLIGIGYLIEAKVAHWRTTSGGGLLGALGIPYESTWACGLANSHSILENGEWWRLFTAIFLHASPLHLGMNCYVLDRLGRWIEPLFGTRRALLAFIVTGLCSSLLSVAWMASQGGGSSLGASGAICGYLGLLFVYMKRHPSPAAQTMARSLGQSALMILFVGFLIPGIDNAGHFGGFLGGCALAFVLKPQSMDLILPKARLKVISAATVLLCALTLVACGIGWIGAQDRHDELHSLRRIGLELHALEQSSLTTSGSGEFGSEDLRSVAESLPETGSAAKWREELLKVAESGSQLEFDAFMKKVFNRVLSMRGP